MTADRPAHDRVSPRGPICIVQRDVAARSETFIRMHAERLPRPLTVMHGFPPHIDGIPVRRESLVARTLRKGWRTLNRVQHDDEVTAVYSRALRRIRPRVVLAEYGPMGVEVREACRALDIPLVVHFHGYDASQRDVLRTYRAAYQALFRDATGLVVVSQHMRLKLMSLGASPWKVHLNPYGVDAAAFSGSAPELAEPTLLAVGRFVDKKAPQITLAAFAAAHRVVPTAQLRMIGDGPLMQRCRVLVDHLGLGSAVTFLGAQPPVVVRAEMRRARAFVQHSVEAASGDCEGLPNTILEAGAAGLPVIATRHAGIPEIVVSGETGVLVDERDAFAMADAMIAALRDPDLAARMGRRARARVSELFSIERSVTGLVAILDACSASHPRFGATPGSPPASTHPPSGIHPRARQHLTMPL